MSLAHYSRSITVSGFSAEVSPVTTEPAANKIFSLAKKNDGDLPTIGHHLLGVFDTDEAAGNATFTTWYRKSSGDPWAKIPSATLTHRVGKTTTDVPPGEMQIFVQVTALGTVGAATTFTIYATEV